MPRPTTKEQLLSLGASNFDKLFALINSMNDEEQRAAFSFDDRDKNVRDVLVHLYEWHMLLIRWIGANLDGVKASFLPDPYTWKTYPAMNVEFWEKHQDTSLEQAVELIKSSHSWVEALIESFTDEALFTRKYYSWTGTTSLGSYCVSSTSSHYDWAFKKIKKHKTSIKV